MAGGADRPLHGDADGPIRYNLALMRFYDRLRASGEVSKVVVIASARKLLTILKVIARDRARWDAGMASQTS